MRWIVGIVLISAALLKAIELFLDPINAFVTRFDVLLGQVSIVVESLAGLAALSGLYWARVKWMAAILFMGLAAYSLSIALRGQANCGCFGPFRIHPLLTFGLDLAIVGGLSVPDQAGQVAMSATCALPLKRSIYWISNYRIFEILVACLMTCIVVSGWRESRRTGLWKISADQGRYVDVLEPDQWTGKELPIADSIDLDLSQGKWIVLLHQHDCTDCQAAVPRYKQLALQATDHPLRVAIVEVPPFGDIDISDSSCSYGRLREDHDWFIHTPMEIRLDDGIVVSASSKLPALALLKSESDQSDMRKRSP
jgi:hypothetical protein